MCFGVMVLCVGGYWLGAAASTLLVQFVAEATGLPQRPVTAGVGIVLMSLVVGALFAIGWGRDE
jgi:hypothetical protein